MSDQFRITAPQVKAAGTDVPPEQIQFALNSIAQQVTIALNTLVGEPEPPSGPAGGDLSGTYPNPTVSQVNGSPAGTMANQNANAVAITGGTITGLSPPLGVTSGGTGQNALSAHNVLVGEGSSGMGFVAPGTAGNVLGSNGASADPSFQTPTSLGIATSGANSNITSLTGLTTPLSVAQGGTGANTLPQYSALIGNAAGAVASAAPGTAGNVLTSNGTGVAPTFQAISALSGRLLNVQVFTAGGTYTPTTGTNSVVVVVQAAGGGSGGAAATSTGQNSASSGSGAGAYAMVRFTSGFSGATVTIGAVGSAGTAGGAGGNASASSFGSLISCPGGIGSTAGGVGTGGGLASGSAATSAPTISGGTTLVSAAGAGSLASYVLSSGTQAVSAPGANSLLGAGGALQSVTTLPAVAGTGYGAGASGAINAASQSAAVGMAGRPAIVIVYEYS